MCAVAYVINVCINRGATTVYSKRSSAAPYSDEFIEITGRVLPAEEANVFVTWVCNCNIMGSIAGDDVIWTL